MRAATPMLRRATGHAVARRTEPTFAPATGPEGQRLRVLHPGSAPAQMSLWLRPAPDARRV